MATSSYSGTQALLLAVCSVCAAVVLAHSSSKRKSVHPLDDGAVDRPFRAGQGGPEEKIKKSDGDEEEGEHVPYYHERLSLSTISHRAQSFYSLLQSRRTLRFFSSDPVPRSILETIIASAATAPSGAHKQPWHFCLVGNTQLKQKIRSLVEKEEQINYKRRMKQTWVDDLKGMMSGLHNTQQITKPYLTEAPWLIVVLKQPYGADAKTGKKAEDHYYVPESVGIACGMLVTSIHNANLVSLTSTPMGAGPEICRLLERPSHEKVYLLLPVGFPAKNATVPYRVPERKALAEILTVY